MRRVNIQPEQKHSLTGRMMPQPQRGTMQTQANTAERIDFTQSNYSTGSLPLDGMQPARAMSRAGYAPAAQDFESAPYPDSDQAAAWQALNQLGERAQVSAANIDFPEIESEFETFGALSEQTYQRLEAAGIPRYIVEAYIEGQLALGQQLTQEIHHMVGGADRYQAMLDWAMTALSHEELQAFDQAMTVGTVQAAKLAVQGLYRLYTQAVGEPPRLVGGARAGRSGSSFASTQELVEAIRDPRYKKDPAYRAEVEKRLGRSNIFKR